MSKRRKSGRRVPGNPAGRPVVGDPTGIHDPRKLGGAIAGPGGPRDRGQSVLDATDSVLLRQVDVATVDTVRAGERQEQAIFMTLGGRVNRTSDVVSVGFVFGPDGAAALITELLAVADRFGVELLSDVTRRLVDLSREGNVDLLFLQAALGVAVEERDGFGV